MPVHRIRLRGRWEVLPLSDGRMRHLRPFGRPRTLDPNERAWLVCDAVPGSTTVILNGSPLGSAIPGRPFEADITDMLGQRNEVTFDVAADPTAPLGEVALEIRRA